MYFPSDYTSLPGWQKAFIEAALDDGCFWVNSGGAPRLSPSGDTEYPQLLVTPDLGIDGCAGRFSIGFDNGDVIYYYERMLDPVGLRSCSCGRVPESFYDRDSMIDKANTCPICQGYVGADNMRRIGKDGRACSACAENRRRF